MLTNSTVSGNSASHGGGGIYSYTESSNTTLTNSIVAYSLAGGDCDGTGTFIDGGNNFRGDLSCPGITITPGTDFDITLANNGGPTETHALFAASVALDAAGVCGLTTDQRFFSRSDGSCDSGSYEFGGIPVIPVSIDIKPGIDPNSFNCFVINRKLPVAILSDATFDATTVDADTVRFGKTGSEAAEVHQKNKNGTITTKRHVEDVNKDDRLDMVFHVLFSETGFSCDDIPPIENSATLPAKLSGATQDGRPIEGEDTLRLVAQ